MTNEKIKQIIVELEKYIKQFNETLEGDTKEQYEKIIKLAGELNDNISQR